MSTRTRARHGNIMIVVAVLCMLAFVGISSMDYLTRGDVSSTAALVRELQATYLAESIAAQIDARVSSRPWEERFWETRNLERGTPGKSYTFEKATGEVKISGEGLPDSEYDFVCVVKDLKSGGLHDYRIYVELNVQGQQFTFSWDKRASESLLTGLNRDASRLDKHLEDVPPDTPPTDDMLDKIKEASNVPAADAINTDFQKLLENLHSDTQLFQGGTEVPPKPAEPLPPPAPTYDPSSPPPNNNNNSPP